MENANEKEIKAGSLVVHKLTREIVVVINTVYERFVKNDAESPNIEMVFCRRDDGATIRFAKCELEAI